VKKPGRRQRPSAEDRALWETVSKDIAPLKRRPKSSAVLAKTPSTAPKPTTGSRASAPRPVTPDRRPNPPDPPRLAPLDRRARARIAKGAVAIDARIDLHGLTQASAYQRLRRFLKESQAAGAKLVLVITGKGRQDETRPMGEERGVLRRSVPSWLGSADLRGYIIGYEAAGRTHGGEGALYVRIKSRRKAG
jgi:DNA-nicking Smr family endonuclease